MKQYIVGIVLILFSFPAFAARLPLPVRGNDVVGQLQFARVKEGDTFETIARKYDVGFYELVEANPEVDPNQPARDTILIIPTQYVLPHVPRKGIIINLAVMRLYYFPKGKKYFYTYPVGIGKKGWSTPLGSLHIIDKIKDPIWIVPKSIFVYRKAHGDPVPPQMPAGPDNPLGKYAMRLSKPTYLVHGTNDPSSVGRRSSAGCIHLYPEDIKNLFAMTAVGTGVFIMNQPYAIGWQDDRLYLEAHLPLQEQRKALAHVPKVVLGLVSEAVGKNNQAAQIQWQKASEIVKEHSGLPTIIN